MITIRGVVSSSVRLPDFARTSTFRWTLAIAGAFVVHLGVVRLCLLADGRHLMSENDVLLA